MKRELLYYTSYNDDDACIHKVERVSDGVMVDIIVYDISGDYEKECGRLTYSDIGEEYYSPYLNWYNVIFCSRNYGPQPDYEYMNTSVQKNLKTAATILIEPDSTEGKSFIARLPDNCNAIAYTASIIYVFHKGKLSDFFDFEKIKSIYERHHIRDIDWEKVRFLFEKDLSWFGNKIACGFDLHEGGDSTIQVIIGLLLGYPIESTIAWINNSIKISP